MRPLLLAFVLVPAALAAPVTVTVRHLRADAPATDVEVVAHTVARSETPPARVRTKAPGAVTLDLAPDHDWSVRATAERLWSAERMIGRGSRAPVELVLWPSGKLRGTATADTRRVTVRFRGTGERGEPEGQVVCPVIDGAWTCDMPAATLDLRIRPDDGIAMFRWEVVVPPGGSTDAGLIPFRRGASVSGWVELTPALDGSPRHAIVTLEPEVAKAATDNDTKLSVHPNDRGFFHFDGVVPGRYVVRAIMRGAAEASRSVRVLADREAELLERLTLDVPKELALSIQPPLAPDGERWRLELLRAIGESSHQKIAAVAASEEGRWTHRGLSRGTFTVMVLDAAGRRWSIRSLEIGDRSEELVISVPLIVVKGTVRLGSEPLRATLIFGGEHGVTTVELTSNDDGEFAGVVPAPSAEGWDALAVRSDEPPIRRTVSGVKPRVDGDGNRVVDVVLPSGSLRGIVRDLGGVAVPNALLTLRAFVGEQPGQLRSGSDGAYRLSALAAGRYVIRAESRDRESDWVEFIITDDDAVTRDLTVLPKTRLTGRVTSDHGPLPNAVIEAFPTEHLYPSSAWRTDPDGRFEVRLPPWTRNVTLAVRVPGYALRLLAVAVDARAPLVIALGSSGGRLVCDVPSELDTRKVWLVHDGAAMLAHYAPDMTGGTITETEKGKRLIAPLIGPGHYALCVADDALQALAAARQCAAGTLAPGGELMLTTGNPR